MKVPVFAHALAIMLLIPMAVAAPRPTTTADLKARIDAAEARLVLVDARCPDAFLGWPLDGVARGGHLLGAVNLPARWLADTSDQRQAALTSHVERLKLRTDDTLVVYDVKGADRMAVATWLQERGYRNVNVYDLRDWAGDPGLPLVTYPNHHWLVPPVIAKAIMDGNRPVSFESSKAIKFVEVSWGDSTVSYDKGHLPTSIHVDTNAVEPPPQWTLASPLQLEDFARQHGIRYADTVILSGEEPMASFRLAVVLRYMGVRDVRVLHGGHAAWLAEGFALEKAAHVPKPVDAFGCPIPARPEVIDQVAEVKRRLVNDADFLLVDNRTWEEHVGKISGYSYHDKKGRIPGSVYGCAGTRGPLSLDHYRNLDQTMRRPAEIRALWRAHGIDPDKHLSFMCGGGWRAAEVLFYAQVMGLTKVSLYSDGWIGWSRDPDNAIETGSPIE